MAAPLTINDCMRRNPITIDENANLVQAIERIVENKLTGLTVVDAEGHVAGVLSELDCIRAILAALYNDGDPEQSLVAEVMTQAVNTCKPADGIIDVAQSMLDTRQRRRPVIEDGRLVGQVSSANILWALMEHSRRKVHGPKA